jgi:hypothetical protein
MMGLKVQMRLARAEMGSVDKDRKLENQGPG